MKNIKKCFYIILIASSLLANVSCEDLALGNKFLQKPPSSDVTIDTIYSTAEYARRVLWYSYQYLPYGLETRNYWTTMWNGNIEGLTDLNQCFCNTSGPTNVYYPGNYNAGMEDTPRQKFGATKIRFNENETHMWKSIRHAWLTVDNIDRTPDMSVEEKNRLKAEAKVIVAIYYTHMLRHYGSLPIVDKVLHSDSDFPPRSTLQQTVDFIDRLLQEAIDCSDFPWSLSLDEFDTWYGRVTKAAAYALRIRLRLFVASPLFNNEQPYFLGKASEEFMTWFGNYDIKRWEAVVEACEDFFVQLNANGGYKLVEKDDVKEGEYRYAFRQAYFSRGNTETLIPVLRNVYTTNNNTNLDQSIRWGGYSPTKEYFDMFQMADGTEFSWENKEHAKNPFINRDPRLSETMILDGDMFQGRTADVTQEKPNDKNNYPAGKDWGKNRVDKGSLNTGIACRKWGLDRKGEYNNKLIQWPHLRLAEIYLSYAEALNEFNNGPTPLAYEMVDRVRARVGMKGLKECYGNMDKEQFRNAILRERACEFGYEEVRFFDLIRWKMTDRFTTPLHGLNIYKHKDTKEYIIEPFELTTKSNRVWWHPGGFSEKWYLSAFPANEVNKGYGLVQNPGWE